MGLRGMLTGLDDTHGLQTEPLPKFQSDLVFDIMALTGIVTSA